MVHHQERDVEIEILKQRLPPKIREKFDTIFVDKKELDAKQKDHQAEKQRRTRRTR
jgi:hypothetical protein